MIQYLLVLVDSDAPSFCYYPDSKRTHERMSLPILKQTVRFAQTHNLRLNLLTNETPLPQSYHDILDAITHCFFIPIGRSAAHADDILVLSDLEAAIELKENKTDSVILRVPRTQLSSLSSAIRVLSRCCRRVNVHILDIDQFKEADFETYKTVLSELSVTYTRLANRPEISILTDRIMLREMHNCGAGETHLTVAPDGHFYICPGFYGDTNVAPCGDVYHGLELPNAQLYKIDHAPICQKCDAWHCRRCIWMNRKTTREVNTPSHEQCVCSHLERNTSARFCPDQIPAIQHLDPFELI